MTFTFPLNDPAFVLSRLIMRRDRYRAMNLNTQWIQKEIDRILYRYPDLRHNEKHNERTQP